ncbi:MAG: hydroxyacid dehydrogenase [Rhodoglobus sp.]|nr:hydroxyacid dehydrogenase [Rhodoglobus sp.]
MIRTITIPDAPLLEALRPAPETLRLVEWNLRGDPVGVDRDDIDAVILPYIDAGSVLASLSLLPNLKLVQTQTTGYDGVREAVGEHVAVATASGVHAAATAELAIGLMLASLRGIDVAARDQHDGVWRAERRLSLADRRVLLVGVGGIGGEIAKRLEPFEVELTRVGSSARDDEHGHIHGAEELPALAANAEVVVVITPLTEATRNLIDATVLAALPDGALVVNVARGPVVDSAALTAEVVSGRLKCAIDVFDPEPIPAGHPLWTAKNALITPHIGGNTSAFEPRIRRLIREQLAILEAGGTPKNLVQPGPFA